MIICRKRFRGHGKQWPQDCIVPHPLPKPLLCSNNVVAEPKLLEQQLLLVWGPYYGVSAPFGEEQLKQQPCMEQKNLQTDF